MYMLNPVLVTSIAKAGAANRRYSGTMRLMRDQMNSYHVSLIKTHVPIGAVRET